MSFELKSEHPPMGFCMRFISLSGQLELKHVNEEKFKAMRYKLPFEGRLIMQSDSSKLTVDIGSEL